MLWIMIALLPWILYWLIGGVFSAPIVAITLALVISAATNVYHYERRLPKLLEFFTLGYFAVSFIFGGLFQWTFLISDGTFIAGIVLMLMGAFSLTQGPGFIFEYSRDEWSPLFWVDELFRRTNRLIAIVWIGLFALIAISGLLSGPALFTTGLIPLLLLGAGGIFSPIFGYYYPLREHQRTIAKDYPYQWPDPDFMATRPQGEFEHDVVIIGSGIGGLTTGALLAKRGLNVFVAEQHFLAGGYCTSWERGVRTKENRDKRLRYVFDAGVYDISGVHQGGTIYNLLKMLGAQDRIQWQMMSHEYTMPDGSRMKIPAHGDEVKELWKKYFPAEAAGIDTIFKVMRDVYKEVYGDVAETGGAPRMPRTAVELMFYAKKHPNIYHWDGVPYPDMVAQYVKDPVLRQLFCANSSYIGDKVEQLTVVAMAPIFGYYYEHGFYPCGSSQVFSDTLVGSIEENGSKVQLRNGVKRILIEQGRAVGVELENGDIHRSKAVISNADIHETFVKLVEPQLVPSDYLERIKGLQPSNSAFMVFLGLDYIPDTSPLFGLGLDAKLWAVTVSKADPSLAPEGHSSLTLFYMQSHEEAITWDRSAPGYAKRKREFGDKLIAEAEKQIKDLSKHIVYRQDASPATFTRYAWVSQGAIYGIQAGQTFLPTKTPIPGLYMVGAGTFPGPGVEAAAISGIGTADIVYPAKAPKFLDIS